MNNTRADARAGVAAMGIVAGLFAGLTSWRVTRFGWQVLDDPTYALGQTSVTDPLSAGVKALIGTPGMGHPMPVTNATWALDHALWGTTPAGWHMTSLLLFVLTIALLPWVYAAVGRSVGVHVGAWAAGVATLVVAAHWCNAEVVGWVTSRKDVCAGLFSVTTLGAAATAATAATDRAALRWSALAFGLGALALGSKGSALLLPALLVALGAAHRRRPLWLAGVALAIPAVAAGRLVRLYQAELDALDAGRPLAEDLASIGLAAVGNAGRLLAPHPYAPISLRHLDIVAPPALVAAGLTVVAGLLALSVWSVRVIRSGRPHGCWFVVVAALVSYLPMSGIFGQVKMLIGDRYLWLPILLAVGPAVAFSLAALRRRVGGAASVRGERRWAFAVAAIGAAAVISLMTGARSDSLETWRSAESFSARLAASFPATPRYVDNGAYWVACNQRGLAAGGFVDYGAMPPETDPARRVELLCTARERWSACLGVPLTCPGPELACQYRARLRRNVAHAEELLGEALGDGAAAECARLLSVATDSPR